MGSQRGKKKSRGSVATPKSGSAEVSAQRQGAAMPCTVKWAGLWGMLEGLAGVLFGLAIVVMELSGYVGSLSKSFGYGTAAMFFIIFGFVAVAGWFMSRGRLWGRAPVIMLNIFLLPISWYMFSSGRLELAIPTFLIGAVGLFFSFHPDSTQWASMSFEER